MSRNKLGDVFLAFIDMISYVKINLNQRLLEAYAFSCSGSNEKIFICVMEANW